MINNFTGQYDFLSNSYECSFYMDDIKYRTVDQACLSSLLRYNWDKEQIRNAPTVADAYILMKDLERNNYADNMDYRYLVLKECLLRKFLCNDELLQKLWGTGDQDINDGTPDNVVGRLLMEIRRKSRSHEYVWAVQIFTLEEEDGVVIGYYKHRDDAERALRSHQDYGSNFPCPLDNSHLIIIELM